MAAVTSGAGSAIVLTPDGFLLTSAHVVTGPRSERASRRGVASFTDGRELAFEVVGADPLSELAVLRAHDGDLIPADLGDAAKLRVRQLVIAIGNPHGFAGSATRDRSRRARERPGVPVTASSSSMSRRAHRPIEPGCAPAISSSSSQAAASPRSRTFSVSCSRM
jgi:S1-C subfamily serine protease